MRDHWIQKITALLFGFIFISLSATAQRILTGKVIDSETKMPIKDAEIVIPGAGLETTSDEIGYFKIMLDVNSRLYVKSPGYESLNVKVPVEADNFQVALTKVKDTPDTTKIFTVVEEPAQYPGGKSALFDYLSKNIKFPDDARRKGIVGTVFVQFVVGRTGEISDINVIKGLFPSCDEEVIRLVEGFSKWIPGRQNGKNINSRFVLPIKFNLAPPAPKSK